MESELVLSSIISLVGDEVNAMDVLMESETELEDSVNAILVGDGFSATEVLTESELDSTGVVLI